MIPGHVCNAYCSPESSGERGQHCELVWSNFDHDPSRIDQRPRPYESVRRHYDDAYRRRYGARIARCQPAREAQPVETLDPIELTPLVGNGEGDSPWLVWFVPPGPAAGAFAAAEEAAYRARLDAARGRS